MDAFAGEGVEEDGERRHEGLALAGGHLGDVVVDLVAAHHSVEHHAADQLHVVVHHVPFHLVAAGHPFVFIDRLVAVDGDEVLSGAGKLAVGLGGGDFDSVVVFEAASRLLHHGKHFGEHAVEVFGVIVEHLFAEIVDLLP